MSRVWTEAEIDEMPAGGEMDRLIAQYVMHRKNDVIPPYSTGRASVWTAVDRLWNTRQWPVHLVFEAPLRQWEAKFHRHVEPHFTGYAKTDTLALCRAMLKAVLL